MNAIRHWIFKVAYFGYNTTLGRRYWLRKLNDWHVHAASHNLTSHSVIEPMHYGRVEVVAIPVGFDNYSYLVRCEGVGVLVDVGDPETVLTTLNELGVSQINAVLITHKHWDHQHGAEAVAARYSGCLVYGGVQDFSSSSVIKPVTGGSEINVANWLKFLAISTPGHTAGHTCYILRSSLATDASGQHADLGCSDMLFCGDHLFLYGCGRVFESPFPVMLESFEKLLSVVDDRTLVFPGHEYTLINLQFTLYVLPDDAEILQCFETALRLRINHKKTCPETWAQQKRCNLFLRYKDETLLKKLADATGTPESEASPLELFTMLRKLKDQFSTKSRGSQEGSSSSHNSNSNNNNGQANNSIAAIIAKLQQERIQQELESNSSKAEYRNSSTVHRTHEYNRKRSQNSGSLSNQTKTTTSSSRSSEAPAHSSNLLSAPSSHSNASENRNVSKEPDSPEELFSPRAENMVG